jgi:hypothetical protein
MVGIQEEGRDAVEGPMMKNVLKGTRNLERRML